MRTKVFCFVLNNWMMGRGKILERRSQEGMKGLKQPWGGAGQQIYKGRAPGRGHEHTHSGLAGRFLVFKIMEAGTEEMAQRLGALSGLAKDLTSVPNKQVKDSCLCSRGI